MEISPAVYSSCSIDRFSFLLPPPLPLQSHLSRPSFSKPKCLRHSKHRLVSSVPTTSKSSLSSQQRLAVTCSDSDGDVSADLTSKPAEADSSIAVKRKAAEIANDLKGTSVFLVGMNCSMKTCVGKVIADALRYYYFDSDSLVEEAGCDGGDSDNSFRERDADGFRESETEVLKQLSSMGRLVVTAGNGAVQSSTNLALLRHGICLWIDVPLDIIAKEIIQENGNHNTSNGSPESSSELISGLDSISCDLRRE